jgi:L-ascorbate metabolism protein UlaG (beta-lactamase superfamily)
LTSPTYRLMLAAARIGRAAACLSLAAPLAAQEPPRFTGIDRQPDGDMRLHMDAPAGFNYRIDVSTNLPGWQSLASLAGTGACQHVDSAAPFLPSRFYRVSKLADAGIVTGDHLATTNGDVVIHPVNHASIALRWNERLIYVDPAANSFAGIPRADLILFTHDHADHFVAGAIAALTNNAASIIAPQAVYAKLSAGLKGLAVVLTNGMSADVAGVTIEAVPSCNLANTPHARGVGNGYVLTLGGSRIYVAGDTEDIPEMRALRDISVAFLPINTPYTMTVDQAVSAVRAFRPGVIYPCHYRNQDGTFADLASFKRQVMENPGAEVRLRPWY